MNRVVFVCIARVHTVNFTSCELRIAIKPITYCKTLMPTFKHARPNILQIDNSSIEFMSFGTFQELPPDWEQSFTREGKRFFIKYEVVLKQRFRAT